MRPDHPVGGEQFDRAVAPDDKFGIAAVHRDQIDAIAVMIDIMELLFPALDLDRPVVDPLLARPVLGGQAQLLQRIADGSVIAIMGGMIDTQEHRHSTKR